ncbi:MAG: hypothetical protein KF871_10975 [Hydrogenophaga sp.]|uniref:phage fiber-tail adaptor protein n=1 Tax=Hydrogenophaga sp. TaxID=1904254 RepID=UPI001D9ED9C1|nr:hypothetical protein [Hydrogenophaga sp.]MBX3610405.1 hypothetical protein [Hydrogenophaga sp.]
MPILERFTKQPADVQDYDIDFAEYLDALTDTAASAVVEADVGLTIVNYLILGKVVKVWVSAGTSGQKYKVTVRLTTTGGRVKEVEFLVIVRDT